MTQLLISVKDVEETMLALGAGVDIIDLKDPNIGALGALGLNETKQIVQAINSCEPKSGNGLISATIGEQHTSLNDMIDAIKFRANIGIDIIKIGVSELFYVDDFLIEISKLTATGVKLVAVFFTDEAMDFNLLTKLQKVGFYGAMLDTKTKHNDLLKLQTKQSLHDFVQQCKKHSLRSGLAGSLKPQYVDFLLEINPTYIGFRGGVCENLIRNNALSSVKVIEVKNLLRMHNRFNKKALKILDLALHS